jgi:hypothetical protein
MGYIIIIQSMHTMYSNQIRVVSIVISSAINHFTCWKFCTLHHFEIYHSLFCPVVTLLCWRITRNDSSTLFLVPLTEFLTPPPPPPSSPSLSNL